MALADQPPLVGSCLQLTILSPGTAEIVMDRAGQRVNVIDKAFIEQLDRCLAELELRPGIRGLVLRSGKPGQFLAGADLDQVRQAISPGELSLVSRAFQRVLDRLGRLSATSVAAIGGPAIGGGLELALACDYRVATDDSRVQLSQREVQLGLIPAGGGTQRLPRLIGLVAGLDLILTGRTVRPRRALALGLVDELTRPALLESAAQRLALLPKPGPGRSLRGARSGRSAMRSGTRSWRTRLLEGTAAGRWLLFDQAHRRTLFSTRGHYPAPLRALEAVRTGWQRGFVAGLETEASAFGELGTGPVSRNLVCLFFQTRAAVATPAGEARPVRKIGVLGAGFMGSGIAASAALANYDVRLRDVDERAASAGLASVRALLQRASGGSHSNRAEAQAAAGRVSATTSYQGFSSAGLVIEAVFEDEGLKKRVIAEVERIVPATTVIASNTSAIPIEVLANGTEHPERIVGMHFFSPVHRMRLVEVVRPHHAAAWAVDTVVATARSMGKAVIIVADGPGFYTSRVVGRMLDEATLLFEEGALPRQIDQAMLDFGFPVGPMALLDEVGLPVAAHVGQVLTAHGRTRGEHASAIDRLIAAGRLGRKSGSGFYVYPRGRRQPDPDLVDLFPGRTVRTLPLADIQERVSLAFVAEALHCLEEGIVGSPADGDLGAVLGLGFPPFLGGPFRYADGLGAGALRARLARLAERHGPRFAPPCLPERFYPG